MFGRMRLMKKPFLKIPKNYLKAKNCNNLQRFGLMILIIFLITNLSPCVSSFASEGEWTGVDESVVEHFAEKAGRSAWAPLINTDQGDLLLFVFLLAGLVGGFVMGYYWRTIFKDRDQKPENVE